MPSWRLAPKSCPGLGARGAERVGLSFTKCPTLSAASMVIRPTPSSSALVADELVDRAGRLGGGEGG